MASLVDQVQTLAGDYGTYSQDSHGILFNISARPRNGLVFQGGVNTDDTRTDYCEVRAALPEQNVAPHVADQPMVQHDDRLGDSLSPASGHTRFRRSACWCRERSAAIRAAPLAANWVVSNALVQTSLGRPFVEQRART